MSNINVQIGQSAFDICLRETGSIESLFSFLKLNNKNDLFLTQGEVVQLPEVLSKPMVEYFDKKTKPNRPRLAFATAPIDYSSATVFADENGNEIVTENNENIIF